MPSPTSASLSAASAPTPAVRPVVAILAQLFAEGQKPATPPSLPTTAAAAPLPLPTLPATAAPAWAQALASLRAPHVDLGDALARLAERLRAAGGRSDRPAGTHGLERLLARFASVDGLDGPDLERRVAEGGVQFEARLAASLASTPKADAGPTLAQLLDLKAELLRARAGLPAGPLARAVETALSAIEEQQLHNVARAEHGESPLLTIPFPDGDGWTTAWLQRRDDGGGGHEGDSESGARLSVGVTFSALGPVRADLTLRADSLWVKLSVGREDVRRALDAELRDLATKLERDGRPVHLSVVLADSSDLTAPIPVVDGQLDVSA